MKKELNKKELLTVVGGFQLHGLGTPIGAIMVLNGYNFSIEDKTVNGLTGSNGVGKSTVFKLVDDLKLKDMAERKEVHINIIREVR